MDIIDRAAGAVLGMAVGEALGAPLEGLTTEEVLDRVGRVEGYVDARRVQPRGRAGYFQSGVYEDETQTALVVADVIVRTGSFSPQTFREKLEELGQPIDGNAFGAFRRARRNFRTSVKRMLKGVPWTETAVNTAGSGAAARGVPIGIAYRDDRPKMLRAALESALVTHKDPRAVASAAAVAAAVAYNLGVEFGDVDAAKWCAEISAVVREAEDLLEKEYAHLLAPKYQGGLHQLSEAIAKLPEWTKLDIESAFTEIINFAAPKGSRPITSAVRGFALTGVVTSFWFFLTGLDVYDATVCDAVSEGGSSDTVGCITGALLGALHGATKIPAPLLDGLKNREQVELRGRVLGGAPREGLKSLLLLEAALTKPAPKGKKGKGGAKGGPPKGGRGARGGGRGGPPRGRGRGGPPRGGRGGGRPMRGGGRGGRPFGGGGRGGFGGPPRPGFGGPSRPGFGGPPRPGFGGPPRPGFGGPPRPGFGGPPRPGYGGPPRPGFGGPPRPGFGPPYPPRPGGPGPFRPPGEDGPPRPSAPSSPPEGGYPPPPRPTPR